ncbi:hypothetical protein Sjap_014537 [Stephania japonica]|uniref:non-specific serine/threonine protein kinase n=1 Tax=Stephania japonica TaxID=461633 RepID=A0AAP0II65_9MAGN
MSRQTASSYFHQSKTLDNKYVSAIWFCGLVTVFDMLGDEIGKGAFGRVYKGLDLVNGDFVAIKQVSLENIAQEDLNIIMNLNHKNIVKYLGSLKTRTHLHIILEYVENGSLANIIKPNKFGPFPEQLVAFYIAQVLEELADFVMSRKQTEADSFFQGRVKLADFGVATKLNEADVNTHSVVGTPYWMAPEVIEMAGVCAASDIWSVGCTVIELLTCVPPYYELQPMPALFRIVQDDHPPISDSLSPEIADFLRQCFKKDSRKRPDAKTLLLHPWIQNSRRDLQSALRQTSGTIRNIQEDASGGAETANGDDQSSGESPSGDNMQGAGSVFQQEESNKDLLLPQTADMKSDKDNESSVDPVLDSLDNPRDDTLPDQDPTLAFHQKSSLGSSSGRVLSNRDASHAISASLHELSNMDGQDDMTSSQQTELIELRKKSITAGDHAGVESPLQGENNLFRSGQRLNETSSHKVSMESYLRDLRNNYRMFKVAWNVVVLAALYLVESDGFVVLNVLKASKASAVYKGDGLSRFSDTPGDATLDDLFHPLDRSQEVRTTEASTSASSSHANQANANVNEYGKNELATKLKAKIAQKRIENETGQANGSDLLRLMMGVLREDAIDIDGLVFDEKFQGGNLFPPQLKNADQCLSSHLKKVQQAVEFSRLVGSLKPEESEEVIVTACQKLIVFFHERPDQKIVFVSQYGLLPLIELLDVPKNRVICSVLQIINQIIKDNTDIQENACLVGMIPVVMNFARPERPREIRMQAAFFVQQLCQSSSLTLQMFIACRGIPVLVGFLEPDYAKYRDVVHLAIDGMWQVFMLQRSTPRNDFCRIAAKNGILIRLINTLHSLNEATRLASISVGGGSFPVDGSVLRPRSGPLDFGHSVAQGELPLLSSDHSDFPKVRNGSIDHPSNVEPLRTLVSHSQRSDMDHLDSRYIPGDVNWSQSSHVPMEASISSKLPELATLDHGGKSGNEGATNLKDWELLELRKTDRAEGENLKQIRVSNATSRISTDKPLKQMEASANGFPNTMVSQQEQVRPLLSLLDKEPPSRHVSGQLEYIRHLSGLERHETMLPLLHASAERKTNGELDFLMEEFAEVTGRGREGGNSDSTPRTSYKNANNKKIASNEGAASTSGIASQTASGVLSGSGVLNARPGSATSSGLLSNMVSTFNADAARDYLEKVADLLLEFARADTVVKLHMCTQSLLTRLFQMFNRVEPPILLKVLQALFNLCKINKRRQEQAAENGIIPHLMHIIMSNSPLKQYALPLLCDMAHASRNSREQLRAHGGLEVYLSLLDDELWSGTALDSLAVCLAHDSDNKKVEQALLKKEAIHKLVNFFQSCPEQHFVHILEPFLKIVTKSARINTTLAVNGLTPLLIARLDHQDAIARLNLLKLIKYSNWLCACDEKLGSVCYDGHYCADNIVEEDFECAVYEHHPRPKQLIVENDLPQKLQNLIEERRDGRRSGGQVLVKQMATALLKALHINTVL